MSDERPRLRLVHSVGKPIVETAASTEPGSDEFQNGLGAIDRVRQWLHARLNSVDKTAHHWESQALAIMATTLEQYEMGQRKEQQEKIDRLKKRWSGGGDP